MAYIQHTHTINTKGIPLLFTCDSINTKQDLIDFSKYTGKDIKDVAKFSLEVGFKASVEAAMKYTPPVIGRKVIPPAFYRRKVEKLADIIQRHEHSKLDAYQFNARNAL